MATQVASLYGLLTLNDSDFTRKLQSANSGLAGLGSTLRGLGANIALATAPLAVGFGFGIRAAADFENVMTEIGARAGLTADEIQRVSDYSLQMGADTMFSGTQAAEAFLQLVTSGSSVEEAFAILPSVLDGAAASGADLGATADGLTNIMASFGLGADDAAAAIDSLARASGSSSAKMPQLFAAFDNVGGSAAAMGLSVDRTSAIFALFAERGISGAEAGTQLRSMLTNIQRPTESVAAAWDALGTSLYDADGNARDFAVVLEEMKEGMEGLSMEEQNRLMQDLAGSYGVLGLQALLSGKSIEEMEAAMAEAASAAEIAAAMQETWDGATNALSGSIETLAIKTLLPMMQEVLTPLVKKITDVVNSITEWVKENPEATKVIIAFGAALVVIGPLLMATGAAIGVVSGALGMLLSPIGLAIGAAVAIGAAYMTNFGGIRDFINNTVRPALDTFFGFLAGVWEQVRPALQNLLAWFTQTGLPTAVAFVTDTVIPGIQMFIDMLGTIWSVVEPALSALQAGFMSVFEALAGPVQTVLDLVLAIPAAVTAAANAITGGLGVYGGLPTSEVAAGLSQMNPFDAAGLVIGAIGAEFGGGRADGGPVMGGTPYIVGERGPELFVPRSSGEIIPNEAMGPRVEIGQVVINSPSGDGAALARSFELELTELMRERG